MCVSKEPKNCARRSLFERLPVHGLVCRPRQHRGQSGPGRPGGWAKHGEPRHEDGQPHRLARKDLWPSCVTLCVCVCDVLCDQHVPRSSCHSTDPLPRFNFLGQHAASLGVSCRLNGAKCWTCIVHLSPNGSVLRAHPTEPLRCTTLCRCSVLPAPAEVHVRRSFTLLDHHIGKGQGATVPVILRGDTHIVCKVLRTKLCPKLWYRTKYRTDVRPQLAQDHARRSAYARIRFGSDHGDASAI